MRKYFTEEELKKIFDGVIMTQQIFSANRVTIWVETNVSTKEVSFKVDVSSHVYEGERVSTLEEAIRVAETIQMP